MDCCPEPEPPDFIRLLSRDVYYQAVHTLRGALPLPITDTPEDEARRDNAAMAAVAALLPVNADEAELAAIYVAASAQALECLRLARCHHGDTNLILRCTAQSASMMRQARAARALLMRVQAERRKLERDSAAAGQAAWTEHCVLGLMAEALGRAPPAPIAAPPPAEPVPEPEPEPPPEDKFVRLNEAEQYAIIYPRRAALIRSLGGLPARPDFGPPPPELVHAIVTGTSPHLRALDPAAAI
jgi:hypothetical protein